MQNVSDKIIYDTMEEILDPSHTALVLWDTIDAFTKMAFNREELVKNQNNLVEAAP